MKVGVEKPNKVKKPFTEFVFRIMSLMLCAIISTSMFTIAPQTDTLALNFDSIFSTFGEVLPQYTFIETLGKCENLDEVRIIGNHGGTPGTSGGTGSGVQVGVAAASNFTNNYYDNYGVIYKQTHRQDGKNDVIVVSPEMISQSHLSIAKDIYNNVPAELWLTFITEVDQKVRVSESGKVSKMPGVSNSAYKSFKNIFSSVTGGNRTGNIVKGWLDSESITGETGEFGLTLKTGVLVFVNFIVGITMFISTTMFIVQTSLDLPVLSSSTFRTFIISANQSRSNFSHVVTGWISEEALVAVGMYKSYGNIGYTAKSPVGGDFALDYAGSPKIIKVDILKYATKRLLQFVFIMTYWVLLMTGLLGDLLYISLTFVNTMINEVQNLFFAS